MQNILILGAGLSTTSLINYILGHSGEYKWKVVVGDVDEDMAKKKTMGFPLAEAIKFDVFNEGQLTAEVKKADLVISMLPAKFHPLVAEACVKHGRHMITASYVSPEMNSLDKEAKKKGLLLLNEIGVDPGIDHMSAMKVIHAIQKEGGKVTSFESYTGGLVAPESDDNPWNYKFSWNPRNVVLAGQGVSKFLQKGMMKYIPYHKLYSRIDRTSVPGYGDFEIYANRDSLQYREIYGLRDIQTMFRGTMRRPGYCEAWNVFVQLGMTDDTYIMEGSENMRWRDFINSFLAYDEKLSVEEKLCRHLGLSMESETMKRLVWLGIFDEERIAMKNATPAQALQKLLVSKWILKPGDKDMIVMQHRFIYEMNGKEKCKTSTLVVTGHDQLNTAMAITVGTPVAIATKMMMTGQIKVRGVQIPIIPELYGPVLAELEAYGVVFNEEDVY